MIGRKMPPISMSESHKRSIDTVDDVSEQSGVKRVHDSVAQRREVCTVLVKNLPKSSNQNKLKKYFNDCGKINHVDIVDALDKSCRVGRIEFSQYDETLTALTKTYKKIGSNEIEVIPLENCTLWLTNFPPSYTAREIRNMFKDEGILVISVRFPSLRFNSKRRFAYADVCSREDALRSIEKFNELTIDGYKLIVKVSNPAERTKRTDAASLEKREIFVRNLNAQAITEDSLKEVFTQYGDIESIRIPSSEQHSNNNACAFITFRNKDDAFQSLKSNNTLFGDRTISVTFADSKSYLERQQIKEILYKRREEHAANIISIYPLQDKVSKEQIQYFLKEQLEYEGKRIFLVTDLQGALVEFNDKSKAAECTLRLNGKKFQNKVIRCGTVKDLRNQNIRSSSKVTYKQGGDEKKSRNIQNNRRLEVAPKEFQEKVSNSKPMSNDDFRKMFLGK